MNCAVRFDNCFLTDILALLPCAMFPRQVKGTRKMQFTIHTVQFILSLNKHKHNKTNKQNCSNLLDHGAEEGDELVGYKVLALVVGLHGVVEEDVRLPLVVVGVVHVQAGARKTPGDQEIVFAKLYCTQVIRHKMRQSGNLWKNIYFTSIIDEVISI